MKKIDKLVLSSFIGPFIITFLVVVFILLNIQMLKYFDDIIGKGLELHLLGQLLFYFAIFTTPTAMPLAVLLSALITYGNLGEHFELTAVKSAGISLIRTLRPIFFFVLLLTAIAFYVNNNLVPRAALEAYSLLYDIKQKKPALDLREGSFYNGIPDISIKVNKKFPDGETLKDIIIYDHRKNDGNKDVTVADSGRMVTILNERYLKFELFNGYNYTEGARSEREMSGSRRTNEETLSRSKFSKTQVVFDLSSFQMERTDKKWFQGNRMMRNLTELDRDIDSTYREILDKRLMHYLNKPSLFAYYGRKDSLIMPFEIYQFRLRRDSINRARYISPQSTDAAGYLGDRNNIKKKSQRKDSLRQQRVKSLQKEGKQSPITEPLKSKNSVAKENNKKPINEPTPSAIVKTNDTINSANSAKNDSITRIAKIDSVLRAEPERDVVEAVANTVRQVRSTINDNSTALEGIVKDLKVFQIQWHKIIANSMACIAMFLIGAPLGSIIKRGGLGVPFLVSILFFIIFYLLSMQGEKLAKQGTIDVVTGVWAADFILLIIGLVFLRQARIDARLFDSDFYAVVMDKLRRWMRSKKPELAKSPQI